MVWMDGRGDTLREKANGGPRSPFQEITRLTNHLFNQNRKINVLLEEIIVRGTI